MRYVFFRENSDISNYADESTPYCVDKSNKFVTSNLEQSSTILFEWLKNICMETVNPVCNF